MRQETAEEILKCGANVFLTGEPGSGKTYLLNSYIDHLRRHGVAVAVTASTGIAATHLGGQTIHSWSGIGTKKKLSEYELEVLLEKEHLVRRIERTAVLIIDEISMLEADILDSVDQVIRRVRRRDEPFGGLQIILSGDFFQLPPVSGGGSAGFAFEADVWPRAGFVICYLTEQFRQEDSRLSEILSSLRSSRVDDDMRCELKARNRQPAGEISALYTHNADVDRLNDRMLERLDGEKKTFSMQSRGSSSLAASLKRGCLSPEELVLKPQAVVMCTKNNQEAGYVNGTIGKVCSFSGYSGWPIVETIDGKRLEIKPADWVVEENGRIKAQITQLPLRLAWAITVHKSQGMSLDSACIDLSGAFEYGQGYVALSRVRRLSGLYLKNFNERSLQVHPAIVERDAHFRSYSQAAASKLQNFDQAELRKKREQFLLACGGKKKAVAASGKRPVSTYEQTRRLIKKAADLNELAEKRGLTVGTICNHLERLARDSRLSAKELRRFWQSEGRNARQLEEVIEVLKDGSGLTAARRRLKNGYSYEELRLARMFKDL